MSIRSEKLQQEFKYPESFFKLQFYIYLIHSLSIYLILLSNY